jgi:2,3-bisphosphoglycerate-dependent phosphoglycerate mutase
MISATHCLVLLRHGDSVWNLDNRFTGWTDVPLSDQGRDQGVVAGRQLSATGLRFDEVHTSLLLRTQQTADELLASAEQTAVPRYKSWRLNERHYGQLQGMSKHEIFTAWGEDKSRRWWRGYREPPPPLDLSDPRHPCLDPLYDDLDPALLPVSESLADCQRRLLPYWHESLEPRIASGMNVLVISHGNTLRSFVMHLDDIAPDAVEMLEIPACVPLLYRFDETLTLISRAWLS